MIIMMMPSFLSFQITFSTEISMDDFCKFIMSPLVLLLCKLWVTHTQHGLQFHINFLATKIA